MYHICPHEQAAALRGFPVSRFNAPATHAPLTKATFVFISIPIFPRPVVHACPALGQIVLVFLASDGLDDQLFWFPDEIEPCILGRREIRVTFANAAAVNLETKMSRATRNLSSGQEACPILKGYVKLVRRVHSLSDDRVRSLSLEEYELEVGTETFKLQTDSSYALV